MQINTIQSRNKLQNFELDAYTHLTFPQEAISKPLAWPLADEPHITDWRKYVLEANDKGAFYTLQKRFACLQFPIQAGISQTEVHRMARLHGLTLSPEDCSEGITLQSPDALRLILHQSVAGTIPVLIPDNRADFITLVQAFAFKNEPRPVPESMGACMIAGFNNWDRIRTYRETWRHQNPLDNSESHWQQEFNRILPQKSLYQDRFIILSDGPYSGISAESMGLTESEWRQTSSRIRLEHECTHYFTKRVFGVMRHHVFDELLADYAGIVAALGYYRADWFLQFMGMETYPAYRKGGRLQNYLNEMSPASNEFQIIQTQLKNAAENLERFDQQLGKAYRKLTEQTLALLAICHFSLSQLAENTTLALLLETLQSLEEQLCQKTR